MLRRNNDYHVILEKRSVVNLAVSDGFANERQIQLAFEKSFERVIRRLNDQLYLHARKFLLKKKQAGRKPVIGGVALRGNAEQPRGAFCVLGRVAVFLNVRFRAIELRKHGASRLQEAVTG